MTRLLSIAAVGALALAAFNVFPVQAAATPATAIALSPAECEVWRREQSFAASVDAHDEASFKEHVHPGAVFAAATDSPSRGIEAILQGWSRILRADGVELRWRPHFVSEAAGVAISRGPYTYTVVRDGTKRVFVGTFTSVWTRSAPDGRWRVLLDSGGPPPAPVATEAEALAHLDQAPGHCVPN